MSALELGLMASNAASLILLVMSVRSTRRWIRLARGIKVSPTLLEAAQAWDEGKEAGMLDYFHSRNPYRKATR